MKTFAQFLNLMEDALGAPPAGGPPPGGPPGGGPPMGGPPPMGGGGPPMGGPPPMGGAPGAPPGGAGQPPMKLKSTNVWDVLEKYLSGGQQKTSQA